MLLIYQAICGGLALLIAAVVLGPGARNGGPATPGPSSAASHSGWKTDGTFGLRLTGAIVLVPLLLRLFLVK